MVFTGNFHIVLLLFSERVHHLWIQTLSSPILPSPISPHVGPVPPPGYGLLAYSHRCRPPSLARLYAHLNSFWTVELCPTRRPLCYLSLSWVSFVATPQLESMLEGGTTAELLVRLAGSIPAHSIISVLYCIPYCIYCQTRARLQVSTHAHPDSPLNLRPRVGTDLGLSNCTCRALGYTIDIIWRRSIGS